MYSDKFYSLMVHVTILKCLGKGNTIKINKQLSNVSEMVCSTWEDGVLL